MGNLAVFVGSVFMDHGSLLQEVRGEWNGVYPLVHELANQANIVFLVSSF